MPYAFPLNLNACGLYVIIQEFKNWLKGELQKAMYLVSCEVRAFQASISNRSQSIEIESIIFVNC